MYLRQALALAFVCVVVEPNLACQHHVCTLIGCDSGVSVKMIPPASGFVDGAYTFSWDSDDEQGGCEFVLASGEACSEFEPQPCIVESDCETEFMRTADRIIVDIAQTPESLHITVELGDRVLIEAEVDPDYATSQPNGDGCDPVCRQATVELPLSS
jgi:hypothetical protein